VDIHTYRYPGTFVAYGWLSTNATAPAAPFGSYLISSPNGSFLRYQYDNTGLNFVTGGGTGTSDFSSYMNSLTNGQWFIQVTNASSTNTYYFTVSATGLNPNLFNTATITSPANNAQNVSDDPTFTWTGGPSGWLGTAQVTVRDPDYNYYESASLSPATTSWNTPNPPLPLGTNTFSLVYLSNLTATVVATVPKDLGLNPISGWISTANLDVNADQIEFVVGQSSPFNEFLVARYNFEDTGSPGKDTSGNNNDNNCTGSSGPTEDTASTDAAVGTYAREFFGDTSICYTEGSSAFANLSNAISGSFTVTAWVKTTSSVGSDDDDAYWGMPIWYADGTGANYTEPLSITGSKAAFTVHDENGDPTTVHSTTSVNDGNYHFIAVTRNQTTGLMSMYVDGVLEATANGTTAPLIPATYFDLAGGNAHYTGLVDDLRIYSTNLTAGNIASLFGNIGASPLAEALDAVELVWSTGGNANWFAQTAITHDGTDAARSGSIGDNEESWLETTVTGPGELSFWWKVSSEDGYDYLEFLLDGATQTDLSGDSGWQLETFSITSGTHTLRWNYYKDGSSDDGLDAGFLDEVTFTPTVIVPAPVITLNPFSQTNYPGYNVALLAAATSNAAITWSWYKVGNPAPISNATNALYIPATSGTAGVAGNYFAIATNSFGSATTTVATVTFQSAPLPPDWSSAFTPFVSNAGTNNATITLASLFDSVGNIYTVGSATGTNVFGTNTLISLNGQENSTFLKQTATGTPIWGRSITNNGNGSSFPRGLATAPGDGFYVVGLNFGTNWLGTNQIVSTVASTYLARFAANGSNIWIRTIVGTNANFPTHHTLVSDPDGNVTLSTLISGYTSFGTTNLTVTGQQGILAQYDLNGNVRWVQTPSAWPSYLVYHSGRIYGSMGGSATNYIGGVTNISDRRQALFSLNATNGQGLWVQGIGAQKDEGPASFGNDTALVAVSGTNIFVTGTSYGSNAVFGAITINIPGGHGQYFARFVTNGTAQLATSFGSRYTWPWAAVADPSGNVYVGADFDNYSVFGSRIIAAPFYETVQFVENVDNRIPGQAFVAKFDRNGNPLWARPAQSPSSYLNLRDITLAPDGVWACGFFNPIGIFGTNTIYGGLPPYHRSGFLAKITDGAIATPITLLNPQQSGANFQFQFQSQSGFTHAVQYRTNLVTGQNWQTYSNVTGDGTLKTIGVPQSLFSPAQQGFIRISTQ
jgi:hypothetical protein